MKISLRTLKRNVWILVALSAMANAQSATEVRDKVETYRKSHEVEIVRDYASLLAMPNLASDSDGIRKNADYISSMLQRRGVETNCSSTPALRRLCMANCAPPARNTR